MFKENTLSFALVGILSLPAQASNLSIEQQTLELDMSISNILPRVTEESLNALSLVTKKLNETSEAELSKRITDLSPPELFNFSNKRAVKVEVERRIENLKPFMGEHDLQSALEDPLFFYQAVIKNILNGADSLEGVIEITVTDIRIDLDLVALAYLLERSNVATLKLYRLGENISEDAMAVFGQSVSASGITEIPMIAIEPDILYAFLNAQNGKQYSRLSLSMTPGINLNTLYELISPIQIEYLDINNRRKNLSPEEIVDIDTFKGALVQLDSLQRISFRSSGAPNAEPIKWN